MKAKSIKTFLIITIAIIIDLVFSIDLDYEKSRNRTESHPQANLTSFTLLSKLQHLNKLQKNPLLSFNQKQNTNTTYSFKKDILNLINELFEILKLYSNPEIYSNENSSSSSYSSCSAAITEDSIFKLFKDHFYGGRLIYEAGDESECKSNSNSSNYSYYLLNFEINSESLRKSPNPSFLAFLATQNTSEFLSFLQKNHTYIGFCFFSECNETLWKTFDDIANPEFKQELMKNTGLTISNNKVEVWKFKPENGIYPRIDFKIFLGILIFYVFLKFAMIIYSFTDVRIRKELIVMPYSISLLTESKRSEKAHKLKATELIKYFSLKHQMEILTNDLETYFNDRKMLYFHLLRLIILNVLNFYVSFLTFFVSPKMNLDSFHLMKKPTFNVIKLAYYASNSIYLINGVFFSYKLLALVFKYKNFSAKNFFYFYLHVLIRLIPTIIFFYMVYAFGNEFIYFFSSRPTLSKATFEELYDTTESKRLKEGNALEYFLFLFKYFYDNLFFCKFQNKIQPYLQLICYALNDFIIFSFSVLLFYLLFKLRNKYIDMIYLFSVFALLVKIAFNFDSDSYSKFIVIDNDFNDLNKTEGVLAFNFFHIIYNLNAMVKIDHAYICYFLGNLIGILYFFHITVDPKIDNTLSNEFKNYIPFKFVLKISYFINNHFGKNKKKYMLALFVLMNICTVLLSFFYNSTFVSLTSLLLQVNRFTSFIVQYELIIFNFILAIKIFAAFFIFNLNQVHGKKFILLISRSFYAFIPMCHVMNYYIFVFFQIDMDTYFSNILFFSLATFLIIYLCALGFLLLFEIPLRILFKRKIKRWFNFSLEKMTNF